MDELKFLVGLWPLIVAVASFVAGYAVLQYQSKATSERLNTYEKRLQDAEQRLEAGLNTLRADMVDTFDKLVERSDADINKYMEMERQEHGVIIARFQSEIDKLGGRFETSMDKLSTKIDKLVDYNLAQKVHS